MYSLNSKNVQASQVDGLFQMNLLSCAIIYCVFIMIIVVAVLVAKLHPIL